MKKGMGTQTKSYKPRVVKRRVKGRIELWVPHGDGEIAFVHPPFCSSSYLSMGREILSNDLKVPIGDYTASLLYTAHCDDSIKSNPEFQNIRKIMRHSMTLGDKFYVFNKNFWTEKGVYVLLDENATGINQSLNVKDLEKMLEGGKEIKGIRFSKDGKVRFAPKESYKLGHNTFEEFAKNGFVIASCGVEGAKKLGEVSYKFGNYPDVVGIEVKEGQEIEQRVSHIGTFFDHDLRPPIISYIKPSPCYGLSFIGDDLMTFRYSNYAFGILK